MVISEVFYSLQGEGRLAGVPSVFVRLAGCPLRCRWCDTAYAWSDAAGREYAAAGLKSEIAVWPCTHVVFTGGEPLVNAELPSFIRALAGRGTHITIETAGIAFVPDLPCDLMSISPKLSNSTPLRQDLAEHHDRQRLNYAALQDLVRHYEYQIKFVVESSADLEEVKACLDRLKGVDPGRVFLMPQAATRDELIARSPIVAEMCKETGFTFSQRLHVLLWDCRRGR